MFTAFDGVEVVDRQTIKVDKKSHELIISNSDPPFTIIETAHVSFISNPLIGSRDLCQLF